MVQSEQTITSSNSLLILMLWLKTMNVTNATNLKHLIVACVCSSFNK